MNKGKEEDPKLARMKNEKNSTREWEEFNQQEGDNYEGK